MSCLPWTSLRVGHSVLRTLQIGRPLKRMSANEEIQELIEVLERFKSLSEPVETCGRRLVQVLRSGNKILTAGNGGSAADALHLAEELMGRFKANRKALPAVALGADPTLLTCIGNDYGFDQLFARQVEGIGQSGDALVVFTTSGNSNNLILALQAAKMKGLVTIAVLGKGGGRTAGLADHEIIVPTDTTARAQEVHTLILHTWLNRVESENWD